MRKFAVTNETVRKDLEALSAAKRLIRVHGGATRLSDARFDLPLPARQTVNRSAKSAVARAAAQLVDPTRLQQFRNDKIRVIQAELL